MAADVKHHLTVKARNAINDCSRPVLVVAGQVTLKSGILAPFSIHVPNMMVWVVLCSSLTATQTFAQIWCQNLSSSQQ